MTSHHSLLCFFCFVGQHIAGVKVFTRDHGVGQLSISFGSKVKPTDPHGDGKVVHSQRPQTYEVQALKQTSAIRFSEYLCALPSCHLHFRSFSKAVFTLGAIAWSEPKFHYSHTSSAHAGLFLIVLFGSYRGTLALST